MIGSNDPKFSSIMSTCKELKLHSMKTHVGQYVYEKRELDAWLVKAIESLDTLPFVHRYTEATRKQPDLKIITSNGHVTFAHQYVSRLIPFISIISCTWVGC